jgi:hypothetical protein
VLQLVDGRLYELYFAARPTLRFLRGDGERQECKSEDDECGALHEGPLLADWRVAERAAPAEAGMITDERSRRASGLSSSLGREVCRELTSDFKIQA